MSIPKKPNIQEIIDHSAGQLSEAFYETLVHIKNESEKAKICLDMREYWQATAILAAQIRYIDELVEVLRSGL